jgi:hypothetical protein
VTKPVEDRVLADNVDASPSPAKLTARSFTEYCVFDDKSVIVTGLVMTGGLNAVYVDPPFVEYS